MADTDVYDKEDLDALKQERRPDPGQAHYDDTFKSLTSPSHLKRDGQSKDPRASDTASQSEAAALSNLDNNDSNQKRSFARRAGGKLFGGAANKFKAASTRKKVAAGSLFSGGVIGLILALMSFFGFLNVFRIDNFMSNVEEKGFVRYQVDTDKRSSQWVGAYLALRLGEVASSKSPADRDNIFFRAGRVDNNKPLTDWYRSMRASKFEENLFKNHGVTISSVATQENNRVRFRTAFIQVNNERSVFPMSESDSRVMESFMNGNARERSEAVNRFTENIRLAVDVGEPKSSDKEARKELKRIMKLEKPHFYQAVKRFYVRKSIQNMTGVRSWRFFEGTRDKITDKKIDIRNKIISKSIPQSTKSGKFIQCMFGIIPCPRGTDTNNPESHSDLDSATPDPDLPDGDTDADASRKINGKLAEKFIKVGSGAFAVAEVFDTLSKTNKLVSQKAITSGIYMARAAQAIAVFTTLGIARDQARSGEDISSEEMAGVMEVVDGAQNSEGWDQLVAQADDSSKVSALSSSPAKNEDEYCSEEHQEKMKTAEYKRDVANTEYHYLCEENKIGSVKTADAIEKKWSKYIGGPLGPVFSAYDASGVGSVVTFINDTISSVAGPIINKTLETFSLDDNAKAIADWAGAKALDILGGGPQIDVDTPPGQLVNYVVMGAAASSESAMRYNGGARTTPASAALSSKKVAEATAETAKSQSPYQRYLAFGNSKSLLATTLFSASSSKVSQAPGAFMSSILKAPSSLFSQRASAANLDPYAAANFAGINTYDFPAECDKDPLDESITPATSTNADDLGLISAADLTWELVQDSDKFYGKLYADNTGNGAGELIDQVYSCAIRDANISGAIAGVSGADPGPNALVSGADSKATATGGDLSEGLTVASYNVRLIGLGGSVPRTERAGKLMVERGVNVFGAQEVSEDQFKALLRSTGYKGKSSEPTQRSIFWDSSFELQASGEFDIPKDGTRKPMLWVKLKSKAEGGKSFYFFDIHADPDTSPGRPNITQGAKETLAEINKVVKDKTIPVILVGDMNSNYKDADRMQAYNVFKNQLDLTFEKTKNRKGENCDTHQSHDGKQDCYKGALGSHIDHIWINRDAGIKVNSWENVADNRTIQISDHNPLIVSLSIPGISGSSSTASADGWDWPLSKNDWLGTFGTNIWGNAYCGSSCGRHSGIDMSGTGGDTAIAAHAGKVEKISTSSSCKTSVLIKATGTSLWMGYQHLSSAKVNEGDTVNVGDPIGTVYSGGPTGCLTGPHLHFSIEKSAKISAYSDGSGVCDVTKVECAKKMSTLPPLCFLDKDGRNYGSSVPANQVKGSDYCNQLLSGAGSP